MTSMLKQARIRQIRFCSRSLRLLSGIPWAFRLIRAVREYPLTRRALAAVLGYHRPFRTFEDATAAISGYEQGGHSRAHYRWAPSAPAETARPSDYAALFHMQPLLPEIRSVFDFGGNVGTLLYCYSKYLGFHSGLVWTVYDLPEVNETGRLLAQANDENRLRFTNSLSAAEGSHLFIACGSLHYFATRLPDLISGLTRKPRYVLINRTPLVDCPPLATVQDGGRYRVACMLHNREDLIRSFEALGYEVVDQWQALEHSVIIPCYPDRSAHSYSGAFLRLRRPDPREGGKLVAKVEETLRPMGEPQNEA